MFVVNVGEVGVVVQWWRAEQHQHVLVELKPGESKWFERVTFSAGEVEIVQRRHDLIELRAVDGE